MYRLRFLILIVRCLFSPSRELMDDYELKFFAIPFLDTDVTRLFTQTYASYMGLGRWHYVFTSRFKRAAMKDRWVPVTTKESIVYKRSIRWGQRVTLKTKMLCWDERRFYIRQTFLVNGEMRAEALVEGIVRNPQGPLNPIETFKALGVQVPSPAMPEDVRVWKSLH